MTQKQRRCSNIAAAKEKSFYLGWSWLFFPCLFRKRWSIRLAISEPITPERTPIAPRIRTWKISAIPSPPCNGILEWRTIAVTPIYQQVRLPRFSLPSPRQIPYHKIFKQINTHFKPKNCENKTFSQFFWTFNNTQPRYPPISEKNLTHAQSKYSTTRTAHSTTPPCAKTTT